MLRSSPRGLLYGAVWVNNLGVGGSKTPSDRSSSSKTEAAYQNRPDTVTGEEMMEQTMGDLEITSEP